MAALASNNPDGPVSRPISTRDDSVGSMESRLIAAPASTQSDYCELSGHINIAKALRRNATIPDHPGATT